MTGIFYGTYAIYLKMAMFSGNVEEANDGVDAMYFYIAGGCYLLGIGLYLLFAFLYYKVRNLGGKSLNQNQKIGSAH